MEACLLRHDEKMKLIDQIKLKASNDLKRIVLPEVMDVRTIEAAELALREKIATIILVGDEKELTKKYGTYNLEGAIWIDPRNFEDMPAYIDRLCDIRKSKGMTKAIAKDLLLDPLYFGVMLVKEGDADGMVAGAANSTSDTLRPALQIVKTSKDVKLVSSIHMMCFDNADVGSDGVILFGDTALNEDPDAQALSEIAVASAKTFEQLVGAKAKVAMLSYSSHGSAKSPLVNKVVEATGLARDKAPNYMIDGELQLDAALIEAIGSKKAPKSQVAGQANVLIFPDLNSGNIGYKMAERLAGAVALGAITQGLAKPINDMSRGCNAQDILGVIAITAVQAQSLEV